MEQIVVAKKYRLIGQEKGKFSKKYKELIRSAVKISKAEIEKQNQVHEVSGILYEIDKEATKERNELLNPKKKAKPGRPKANKEEQE